MPEPTTYEIVLRGRASAHLLRPLIDDFTISHASKGVTTLTGDIRDPSHLHGVLVHLTSVNAQIISINPHHPITDQPTNTDPATTDKGKHDTPHQSPRHQPQHPEPRSETTPSRGHRRC